MKRSIWCHIFGCHLVIVRGGFPYPDEWFVRCSRKRCEVGTVTVQGSPWRHNG